MTAVRFYWWLSLVGYTGLLLLLPLWYGWLAPPEILPKSLVLGILLIPLLFPLRGLLYGKPYTFAWTSFLALMYFIHGVTEAWSAPEARYLAILEIIFSLCLYFGAMMFARHRGRELKGPGDAQKE